MSGERPTFEPKEAGLSAGDKIPADFKDILHPKITILKEPRKPQTQEELAAEKIIYTND